MKVHLGFDHLGINHLTQKQYWLEGVKSLGWEQVELEKADVTIMWGPNPEFDITRARNRPVLMIDFPYWNRGGKERLGHEYYKVSLNGQHPTPYIMNEKLGPARYRETFGPEIKPWREKGTHILVAGMGIKAANQYGYYVPEWEKRMVEKIKKQTDLPVYYRSKPRQRPIHVIPGTLPNDSDEPIEGIIENAYCLVCHHGNPTVTALAMGVPVFMNGPIGVASHFASFDFNKIMKPVFLDNRHQFFNNLAYWQWSVAEIKSGAVLQSYQRRGLI